MNTLREAVDEYLCMRRHLGFKLHQAGRDLLDFVTFMEQHEASLITQSLALAWAKRPANVQPSRWVARLSHVRGFARHHQATDPRTEVPAPGLLPFRYKRATPYLYSDAQIRSLMQAALEMPWHNRHCALRPRVYYCLFGLLSVSGLRVSEAGNLELRDVDLDAGVLTVREAKCDRTRLVPLHSTTCEVLADYIARRKRHWDGRPVSAYLFVSSRGNRLDGSQIRRVFYTLSRQIGLRGKHDSHGMLRDAGFTLPEDAEAWEGMSVEEAYDRLPEPEPEGGGSDQSPPEIAMPTPAGAGGDSDDAEDPDSDDSGGQDDSGKQGESGDPDDSGNTDDSDRQNDPDRQDDPNPDGSGDDAEPDAQNSHDPAGTGEVMDSSKRPDQASGHPRSSAMSNDQKIEEEKKWDEAMHQALSIAKAEGKVPGQVREMIQDAHTSTVDWRTLLRRYMVDAVKRDYSWSVPNRRFIDGGLYMPSIRSEGIESIAVIIDTSGSIWCRSNILEAFWSEVRRIMLELQPTEVIVLQVDTLLQDVAEYSCFDLPDAIELKGGGGTDFRPGFEWLEKQGKQPGVCLYLTDMECSSYPDIEPASPVAWINWGSVPDDWNREPWGERIDMDGI